jgi:hypothetical protein
LTRILNSPSRHLNKPRAGFRRFVPIQLQVARRWIGRITEPGTESRAISHHWSWYSRFGQISAPPFDRSPCQRAAWALNQSSKLERSGRPEKASCGGLGPRSPDQRAFVRTDPTGPQRPRAHATTSAVQRQKPGPTSMPTSFSENVLDIRKPNILVPTERGVAYFPRMSMMLFITPRHDERLIAQGVQGEFDL